MIPCTSATILTVFGMSLYCWFAPTKQATKPYLPDPNKEESEKDALEVEATNQCVHGKGAGEEETGIV